MPAFDHMMSGAQRDIGSVIADYRALDVPTVLRMRQENGGGEHLLFGTRLRRLQVASRQALLRATSLVDQPMNELAVRDLRVQAQRAMELGFRLLEVSETPFTVSTVTDMAQRVLTAYRTVMRFLPDDASPAVTGATQSLMSKVDLLSGLDGLATSAAAVAAQYREAYADLAAGRVRDEAVDDDEEETASPRM